MACESVPNPGNDGRHPDGRRNRRGRAGHRVHRARDADWRRRAPSRHGDGVLAGQAQLRRAGRDAALAAWRPVGPRAHVFQR